MNSDGTTVGGCLHNLVEHFPAAANLIFDELGNLNDDVFVYDNYERPRKSGLEDAVKPGD
ncbi:MAG: hypothetical protein JXA46_10990 [Dehalococcoidales bacterium]|nr:hypothetical protein [Dehalococcoidales bacterium]